MPDLKLVALDKDDLSVISAHMQDALVLAGDLAYLPREKRFAAVANRFDWQKAFANNAGKRDKRQDERRISGLRFDRVLSAKIQGIDLKDRKLALSLLAITFEPDADASKPGGEVTLTFAGKGSIRLTVECLEVEMKDLGAVWAAKIAPKHPDEKM